ncbi:hypothetical protein IG631_23648 [Alternaria alternata]|nr:hypothetical protein IG631_23648 [Alternaria alternata]
MAAGRTCRSSKDTCMNSLEAVKATLIRWFLIASMCSGEVGMNGINRRDVSVSTSWANFLSHIAPYLLLGACCSVTSLALLCHGSPCKRLGMEWCNKTLSPECRTLTCRRSEERDKTRYAMGAYTARSLGCM